METDGKWCKDCETFKPRSEWSKMTASKDGLQMYCKACNRRRYLDQKARNPQKFLDRSRAQRQKHRGTYRARMLMREYGLTLDDYDALLASQNGVCAICERPEGHVIRGKVRPLSVDHCHTTGRIRGLLCYRCNVSIGLLGDDPERVGRVAGYLRAI